MTIATKLALTYALFHSAAMILVPVLWWRRWKREVVGTSEHVCPLSDDLFEDVQK